jgi:hypothetical protein
MGLFCVNFHFRSTDDAALSAALDKRGVRKRRVLSAKNGWTSFYEERASEQDERRIRELAGNLTADLKTAAIAFLVHDSDIACYWIYENGHLLDEYNSCPNYFEEFDDGEERATPSGGKTDILVRFCRQGVTEERLAGILNQNELFAERVIEQLARALGIDQARAIADYRHEDGEEGPQYFDDAGDDDDDDGGPPQGRISPEVASRFAGLLGLGGRGAPADPKATALTEAAAQGDTDTIARLLGEGVPVDAEAPVSLKGEGPMGGVGQIALRQAPQIVMTPLLAAVVHKQPKAAKRLLDGGADPNRGNPLLGTAVHAAAGSGDAETLRLLIERGGDVRARDARGQTPLQVIAAGRATKDRLAQVQSMMAAMGAKLPGLAGQLENLKLPTEGWDACERLLKERGAS